MFISYRNKIYELRADKTLQNMSFGVLGKKFIYVGPAVYYLIMDDEESKEIIFSQIELLPEREFLKSYLNEIINSELEKTGELV